MTTVRRASAFPVVAVVPGALGAVAVALGAVALVSPAAAVAFVPALGSAGTACSLLAAGAVSMLVEAVAVVRWARGRRASDVSR